MQLSPDKWRHIIAGFVIGMLLPIGIDALYQFEQDYTLALSLVLLAMIAYGFELLSLITGKGHYDFWDAVATFTGGLPTVMGGYLFL